MKIYSMTATFGKLEHETLTLQPGLNVIYAPNEWGKSTWCTFLLAMLYGIDTREKTTKTSLADKERFAPWSGSPMSGRIDLNWDGRDITIERTTKGRIPLGVFRAYETKTGIEVPELDAANCGAKLLGVEQSVFRRAGFIRFSDLPVTQDEALRRRLNALVTTGDESGDGTRLEKQLRDLKNRCRYNQTGLLPQAEAERDSLEAKLSDYETLSAQSKLLTQKLQENTQLHAQLENHLNALAYAEAQTHAKSVEEALEERQNAWQLVEDLEKQLEGLPGQEEAEERFAGLETLRKRLDAVNEAMHKLPPAPKVPEYPAFAGMDGSEALAKVKKDVSRYKSAKSIGWLLLILLGMGGAVGAAFLWYYGFPLYSAPALAVAFLCMFFGLWRATHRRATLREYRERYGSSDVKQWQSDAQAYARGTRIFERESRTYRTAKTAIDIQMASIRKDQAVLCADMPLDQALSHWRKVLQLRQDYAEALKDANNEEKQYAALKAMAKRAAPPKEEDTLTLSTEDTLTQLRRSEELHRKLQARLGEYRGRMEALGDEARMRRQLDAVKKRIRKLEDTYTAASVALKALTEASLELQRRFAPKIAGRGQALLRKMTDGRYDRLALSEDFTLWTGAEQETVLHDALWRSDGTVDQLYLALRLAVAEELTPQAPLILDDALVRFDENRMKQAVEILKDISENKQVILFTCQKRETML